MSIAYLCIFLAALAFALQFLFTKLYQKNSDDSVRANLWMAQLQSVWVLLIFLPILGFRLSCTPQSAGYALGYAVSSIFCTLASLWAFSMGKIATVSLYMLIGGQAVPFVYGLLFTNANPTWLDTAGFFVMLLSCVPNMLKSKDENAADGKAGQKALFLLLCLVTFLGNGFVSVFSDVNAKSKHGADSNTFLVLFALWTLLFVTAALIVLTVKRRKSGLRLSEALFGGIGKSVAPKPLFVAFALVGGFTVLNSLGNIFSLQAAGTPGMQASVQFPLMNAGIMVFTALIGRIAFREKPNRRELAGILMAIFGILLFAASFLVYGR